MKDPNRLRDQPELPEVLHGALRELGNRTPATDTIARVHRTLSTLPTSTAPFMGLATGWLRAGAYIASAAAVSVLAVATWMRLPQSVERDVEAPIVLQQQEQAPDPRPLEAAETVVSGRATDDRTPAVEASSPRGSKIPLAPTHASQRRSRATKRHKLDHAADSTSSQHELSPARLPDEAASSVAAAATPPSEASAAATVQPIELTAEATQPVVQAPLVARAPVPEDEALLMYRAKKTARTDRSAAWRMLEQHRIHFPTGNLAQEREVLAIELLRRMGRAREANQRAARFIEQYPQSSYRSAIQHR